MTIRGPTTYSWLGRRSRALPASIEAELDESQRRGYLLSCLREELYWSYYCHGGPVPVHRGEAGPVAPDPWLASAMSRANTGSGGWEPGWTVARVDGEEAVVARGRLRARIPVRACRAVTGQIRPDAVASLRLPKELPSLAPGFCTFVGEAPADPASWASIVRVYWNIAWTGAPALVGALTSRLNSGDVPFRLKVADHPFRLARCDAAVLYVQADSFAALNGMLRRVARRLRPHLRPQIPSFTLELAPGVGLAEEAGGRESFGERRCALLADAIVRAQSEGITQPHARLAAVAARFAEDGVQIDAPYLEPSLAGRHVL